jgi:hypothetical protein
METVLSIGSASRVYNQDPRPKESELRQSLQMAVECLRRDGKKGISL